MNQRRKSPELNGRCRRGYALAGFGGRISREHLCRLRRKGVDPLAPAEADPFFPPGRHRGAARVISWLQSAGTSLDAAPGSRKVSKPLGQDQEGDPF